MRVMSNALSLNSFNNLKRNERKKNTSMERLASGFRINRAADDAAGFAISQRMRAKSNGVKQAQQNVQDGISLLQTAEGGLSNIHDSLQRMRELSVQAANDSYNDADRQDMQNEFEQMKNNIDTTANNTEFNTKKLLSKEMGSFPEIESDFIRELSEIQWDIDFDFPRSLKNIIAGEDGSYYLTGNIETDTNVSEVWALKLSASGEIEWQKFYDGGDDTNHQAYELIQLDSGELVITSRLDSSSKIYKIDNENGDIIQKRTLSFHFNSISKMDNDKFILTGNSHLTSGSYRSAIVDSDFDIKKFNTDMGEDIDVHFRSGTDAIEKEGGGYIVIGYEVNDNGFIREYDSDYELMWNERESLEGVDEIPSLHSIEKVSDSEYLILSDKGLYNFKSDGAGGKLELLNDEINFEQHWFSLSRTKNHIVKTENNHFIIGSQDKFYKVNSDGEIIWEESISDLGDSPEARSISLNKDGGFSSIYSPRENVRDSRNVVNFNTEKVYVEEDDKIDNLEEINDINLQVGPNQKENFGFDLAEVTINDLDLNNVSINTREQANNAIGAIDEAIQKVSSERSRFGSYQNSLRHINNNLMNYNENIEASISRIQDTDMAKEISNLTRQNILQEAGLAMLSQANVAFQNVIRLLNN